MAFDAGDDLAGAAAIRTRGFLDIFFRAVSLMRVRFLYAVNPLLARDTKDVLHFRFLPGRW